ncbi:hypothetical protein NQZ79_g5063 [Umbelopsis isabellina]|nr:hypothetical protein NQZ79_g5063 [Umbelopsis isabellina]
MSEKQKDKTIKAKSGIAPNYRAYVFQLLEYQQSQRFSDAQVALMITLVACVVRLYKIWEPTSVVFDEVHFGHFAGKYINHTFFFDVHPPLAKLLIAGVGSAAGYDGNFDFSTIGKDYLESGVPYVAMRLFCGILGVLTIPIAYLTVKASGHSTPAALVAAALTCFENGLVSNNRLILLDSPLLFFITFTIFAWAKFSDPRLKPFTSPWKRWLALTGVGLGCSVSSKWVGLFTAATVGCSTIKALWELWGDLAVSPAAFGRHFIYRALCLIVLPAIIYVLTFDVAYGSVVSIRHLNTNGGYLHSHASLYNSGSEQQQVTLYSYKDDNNLWKIRKGGENYTENDDELEYVQDGDIIRLEHITTSPIKLHSHDVRPPVTDVEYHDEVSGYGFPDFDGDANDYWRVEIYEHSSDDNDAGERLKAINTVFRLVHYNEGCALFSHKVKLPKWGFEQQEVTCIKGGTIPKTLWYIEETEHPLLPEDAERVTYDHPGFWDKFLELNQVMWTSNSALTESHPYGSRPSSWPILQRGISMWTEGEKQIYLLGNPLVYWCTTWAIFSYFFVRGILILREQRGYGDKFGITGQFFKESIGYFIVGWAMHILPFQLMDRQLFLHHYMPALYFGILAFAATFDLLTRNLQPGKKFSIATMFITVVIAVFLVYSPLTYGTNWSKDSCIRSKIMEKWDYSCDTYSNKPLYSAREIPALYAHDEGVDGELENDIQNVVDAEEVEVVNYSMIPTASAMMEEGSGEYYEEDDDEEWYRRNRRNNNASDEEEDEDNGYEAEEEE